MISWNVTTEIDNVKLKIRTRRSRNVARGRGVCLARSVTDHSWPVL